MKKLILILILLCSVNFMDAQTSGGFPKEKSAIVMVHFGTTYDDTRSVTIDAINDKVATTFPGVKVIEAYTSRIIISRLAKRGIKKLTPQEALLQLAADGYKYVVIQSTNVIDGIEAEVLRKEAALMAPFFDELRVGKPLLYSIDDCQKVVAALQRRYEGSLGKNSGAVFIGHGTSTPANAIYSQIDYMFSVDGAPHFHTATVEGYPTYETTLRKLKEERVGRVTLVPFMFVAGDHARNDIDGEWRELLEKEGFQVTVVIEGLGQLPAIQDLYIDHLKAAWNASVLDATSQKANYIKENI
ncbi:MAG: sirohydrochlorin cobaltochelatase [Muribaculaceae bacterium]|nr:sirohydrochlorin cobaltochelatase [Muribaculaceae bacterium]